MSLPCGSKEKKFKGRSRDYEHGPFECNSNLADLRHEDRGALCAEECGERFPLLTARGLGRAEVDCPSPKKLLYLLPSNGVYYIIH